MLAVLAYHVAPSAMPGGFLGVESFFVLSGYLLAAVLLEERARTGVIDWLAYAKRRVRRIAPALMVLLGALVMIGPLVAPDDAHRLRADILSALAGVTNWHLVADHSSYFDHVGRPSLLRHVWSVAVEAQFYLLCPLLVAWVARRRREVALATIAAGVGLSAIVMTLLYRSGDPSRAYYGTDARIGALLAGVLLAVLLGGRGWIGAARGVERRVVVALGPAALLALVALYLRTADRSRLSYPLAFLATQAATAVVIAAALRPGPVAGFLGRRRLRWLGRRSYSIYLWHWPAAALLRPGIDVGWPSPVAGALTVAIAVVLGAVSYRYVERPLLRPGLSTLVRERRSPVLAAAGLVGITGLLGLFVHLPTTDPLAETLRSGARVLAAQSTPLTSPAAPTTATTAPSTTVVDVPAVAVPATAPPAPPPSAAAPPATAAPSPPPAAAPVPPPLGTTSVTAIGDSVMVSAAGALRARLGAAGYIDAHVNRSFSEGVAIARRMREERTLGEVVVVHLGSNGPVKATDIDDLMREVPASAGVLLVNVRAHTPWEGSVNSVLADAAGRYPTVRLVDWYGLSGAHREWFQSDGTHFKTTSGPGANAYADLIVGSLPPPEPAPTTTATTTPTVATTTATTAPATTPTPATTPATTAPPPSEPPAPAPAPAP